MRVGRDDRRCFQRGRVYAHIDCPARCNQRRQCAGHRAAYFKRSRTRAVSPSFVAVAGGKSRYRGLRRAWLSACHRRACENQRGEVELMRKCIATVSLSGTLAEKLDAIAAARFDAIEVFENDLIHFRGSPENLRDIAADRGLGIDLYQPFRDFDAATDDELRRNLDRAERKFDIMETLGAPMMLVCSNATPGAVTDDARIAAQFHALAERAARRNLRIAFEALAWGTDGN